MVKVVHPKAQVLFHFFTLVRDQVVYRFTLFTFVDWFGFGSLIELLGFYFFWSPFFDGCIGVVCLW